MKVNNDLLSSETRYAAGVLSSNISKMIQILITSIFPPDQSVPVIYMPFDKEDN